MSASGRKQTPKNRTYTVEDIAAILALENPLPISSQTPASFRRSGWKHDPHFQKIF